MPIHEYANTYILVPISVLPVLYKLLGKAVRRQCIRFLKEESLLTDCQYGYRAKRSTDLTAIQFTDDTGHA